MSKPNPTPLHLFNVAGKRVPLSEHAVDKYKRVDCSRYEDCLGRAASRNWPQFTCNDCGAHDPVPMEVSAATVMEMMWQ